MYELKYYNNLQEENSETVATNTTTDDHSSEVLDEEPYNVTVDETKHEGRQGPPARKCEVKVMSIKNPNKVFLHFLDKCPNVAK